MEPQLQNLRLFLHLFSNLQCSGVVQDIVLLTGLYTNTERQISQKKKDRCYSNRQTDMQMSQRQTEKYYRDSQKDVSATIIQISHRQTTRICQHSDSHNRYHRNRQTRICQHSDSPTDITETDICHHSVSHTDIPQKDRQDVIYRPTKTQPNRRRLNYAVHQL